MFRASRHIFLACVLIASLLAPVGPVLLAPRSAGTDAAASLAFAASPAASKSPTIASAPATLRTSVPSPLLGASRVTAASLPLAPAASAASPEVLTGWDALHHGVNGNLTDPWTPPDVIMAAGPTRVVEMVNLMMGVYTKQGTMLSLTDLAVLFKTGTDFISDPKVQYDVPTDRWFATVTDITTTQVILAVSTSGDPGSSWRLYNVPSAATRMCLDQPILGVGTNTVIVSVNAFTQTNPNSCTAPYLGAEYWVINKSDLVTGVGTPATYASGLNILEGSIHPVQTDGTSPYHYMVATYWPGTATTSDTLHLFNVSGVPPGTVTVTVTSLTMPTAAVPPPASQLGTRNGLDTGDIRVSDAVWSADRLWLGFDEACLADAARACIRLVQIDTRFRTILQDFDINVAGKHVFYPAFRADAQGDLAVVFGYSSGTDFPGVMASGRVFGDPVNTLQAPVVVVPGTSPEQTFCSKGVCRYGDYFGASRDPSNGSVIWLAGEMGTSGGWSTHVFSVSVKAQLTFGYQVLGGGTGYGAPTLSTTLNGAPAQSSLTTAPTVFLADPGTSWSVSTPLPGSSVANGEVWAVNASGGAPPTSGVATASIGQTFLYFHQYRATLGFTVIGGTGYTVPPTVATVIFGVGTPLAMPTVVFLDAGSRYEYTPVLAGSTSGERWLAASAGNGTVSGVLNLTVAYYHQFLVTFEYTAPGVGTATPPHVAYSYLGAPATVTANATAWADGASAYAFDSALAGGTAGTRWGAGPNGNGTITAPQVISVRYREQVYLTVNANPAALSGSVTHSGWYDLGSTVNLSASAPTGWRFEHWMGDASGAAPSLSVVLQTPMTVTAVFDAGLTITAGTGGSVSYSYGAASGTVPEGTSATIYVPVGTVVTLTAATSSWTEEFTGWTGAPGTGTSTSVTVNAPATVAANFAFTLVVVAGIGLAVVVVIVALVVLLLVVRRRKKQPPA